MGDRTRQVQLPYYSLFRSQIILENIPGKGRKEKKKKKNLSLICSSLGCKDKFSPLWKKLWGLQLTECLRLSSSAVFYKLTPFIFTVGREGRSHYPHFKEMDIEKQERSNLFPKVTQMGDGRDRIQRQGDLALGHLSPWDLEHETLR